MPLPRRTCYLSAETDAEYILRLTRDAPTVTPPLVMGTRVTYTHLFSGEVATGVVCEISLAGDVGFVKVRQDGTRTETWYSRVDVKAMSLVWRDLKGEELDFVGSLCGLQRRLIERMG